LLNNISNSKNNSIITDTLNSEVHHNNKPSRPHSTRPNSIKSLHTNNSSNILKKPLLTSCNTNNSSNIVHNVNNNSSNLVKSDNKASYKYESPYQNKNNNIVITPKENISLLKRPNSSKFNNISSNLNKRIVGGSGGVEHENFNSNNNPKSNNIMHPGKNNNLNSNNSNKNQNNFLKPAASKAVPVNNIPKSGINSKNLVKIGGNGSGSSNSYAPKYLNIYKK